jgi:AcrR family transcriptional regulator
MSEADTPAGPAALDGRTRRSERSRLAMADAVYELVGEGVLRPTAHQVAERAGVGIRTVFRHFSDMDALLGEVTQRVRRELEPVLHETPPSGSLVERSRELVRRRAAFYERMAPYKRSGNVQRWRSPYLQGEHAETVRALRETLEAAIPEASAAPADLRAALEMAASFEAWDRLRSDQRLGPARAQAAIERTVLALVREL